MSIENRSLARRPAGSIQPATTPQRKGKKVSLFKSALIGAVAPRNQGGMLHRMAQAHGQRLATQDEIDWREYEHQVAQERWAAEQRLKHYHWQAEQQEAHLRWEVQTKNDMEWRRYEAQRQARLDDRKMRIEEMKHELERDKFEDERERRRRVHEMEMRKAEQSQAQSQQSNGARPSRLLEDLR